MISYCFSNISLLIVFRHYLKFLDIIYNSPGKRIFINSTFQLLGYRIMLLHLLFVSLFSWLLLALVAAAVVVVFVDGGGVGGAATAATATVVFLLGVIVGMVVALRPIMLPHSSRKYYCP